MSVVFEWRSLQKKNKECDEVIYFEIQGGC